MATWQHNPQDFENLATLVEKLANSIKSATSQIGKKPIPSDLASHIKTFRKTQQEFNNLDDIATPQNVETAYTLANMMAIYATAIAQSQFYDQHLLTENSIKENILNIANSINTATKSRPVLLETVESEALEQNKIRLKSASEKINEISIKIENSHKLIEAHQRRARDLEISISELSARVDEKYVQIEKNVETAISKTQREAEERVNEIFSSTNEIKAKLEFQKSEVDAFIGNLTRKALSGNYMRSAIKEEKIANDFRKAAIAIMIALGIFIIGTIAHMEIMNLEAQKSALRAFGALFFSFVVAYLIRQSAVHRAQHQRHLQTALDLRAIGPYSADMPETDRNEIKKQIAEKIFVPKESLTTTDNGGFGAQEIINKVIDKLELPKK